MATRESVLGLNRRPTKLSTKRTRDEAKEGNPAKKPDQDASPASAPKKARTQPTENSKSRSDSLDADIDAAAFAAAEREFRVVRPEANGKQPDAAPPSPQRGAAATTTTVQHIEEIMKQANDLVIDLKARKPPRPPTAEEIKERIVADVFGGPAPDLDRPDGLDPLLVYSKIKSTDFSQKITEAVSSIVPHVDPEVESKCASGTALAERIKKAESDIDRQIATLQAMIDTWNTTREALTGVGASLSKEMDAFKRQAEESSRFSATPEIADRVGSMLVEWKVSTGRKLMELLSRGLDLSISPVATPPPPLPQEVLCYVCRARSTERSCPQCGKSACRYCIERTKPSVLGGVVPGTNGDRFLHEFVCPECNCPPEDRIVKEAAPPFNVP